MAILPPAALLAVLFASGEPISKKRLATLLSLEPKQLTDVIRALDDSLTGCGLALIETEDELEVRTVPEAAPLVKALRESELSRDLGKASLETLAMILYRESATRSEIDWVRGVNSAAALRSLLLRGLIERSEDKDDKRRARYTATVDALAHLGVSRKEDLPRYAEFSATITTEEAKAGSE